MNGGNTLTLIVVLVAAGLLFFTLEVVTPTFGVLVGLGLAALVAATWLCFTVSAVAGTVALVALGLLVPAYLVLMVKLLPNSPLGRRIFLGKAPDAEGASTPEAPELRTMVGREAVAETDLRPSGTVRIDGRRTVATAETGMIDQGARVKVLRAVGANVVVRQVAPPPEQAQTGDTAAPQKSP